MAIKKVISFCLEYSTIKELKERAKKAEKSTSEYLQELIDGSFYEEKNDLKIEELLKTNGEILHGLKLVAKMTNEIYNKTK